MSDQTRRPPEVELIDEGAAAVSSAAQDQRRSYDWYPLAQQCARVARGWAVKKQREEALAWASASIAAYERTKDDPYFRSEEAEEARESAVHGLMVFLIGLLGAEPAASPLLEPGALERWLHRSVEPWGGFSQLFAKLEKPGTGAGEEERRLYNLKERIALVRPLFGRGVFAGSFELAWEALFAKLGALNSTQLNSTKETDTRG